MAIYSNIVRGFLSGTSNSHTTIDLCVQLALGFSSVKVFSLFFFLHVTNSQIPQIVQDVSLLECLESLVEKDLGIKNGRMTQLLSVAMSLEGEKESDFPSRQMGNLFEIYNCLWFN